MKTGIFYGSATGTTAEVAKKIAKEMGVADADIHDVASTSPARLGDYDMLVLGSSTWGNGDLEDDWYDFVDGAASLDLSGKKVAIFGCGDETMSDTFCNAVGTLYEKFKGTGAEMTGRYNSDGYTFDSSTASDGDMMLGLVLDEVNHPEYTDRRIADWVKEISK